MHRVNRALVMLATGVLLLGLPRPATADPPADTDAGCDPFAGICDVTVQRHSSPGGARPGADAVRDIKQGSGEATDENPCHWELYEPQPPRSDPLWGGRTAGGIYISLCTGDQDFAPVMWMGAPPAGPGGPVVTPAELAQRALATLRLPKPVLHRSPVESNNDDGVPYTWVNLWTWYWTSPQAWQVMPKTASLGSVSATVTAKPVRLTFDPDNGRPAVSCEGPGRPWTERDGNTAPSGGGCGYRYRSVADRVAPTVSITWHVAWTGSGGTGGPLPEMTTETTSPPFRVQQIQVVNR